ncbi:M50 family metallopeptidase [Paludisphaera soli]|uniref:M50 family metallopeptidase n=1 Tax=Paludisphaera soli TaxID=2712865 RepID=UPI0013EDBE89|nr:M50 family metallopeptidase [Paludisphaera soli]
MKHDDGIDVQVRGAQLALIGSTLGASWLGMQVVHEFGHVLAAWADGGSVDRVLLHPLALSRTDVSGVRRPALVAWAGPLLGSAIPVAGWAVARGLRLVLAYLPRFFAGFCLVANGAYLGVGAFGGEGDAGDLLRLGFPSWPLVAFGLVAVAAGLRIWHGLGPRFGLGQARGRVDPRAVGWASALLTAVAAVELGVAALR